MLRVYMVDRSLKWLIEVNQGYGDGADTDFTVRQFLYQLLVQKLKIKKHYLHYGLFI